MSDKGKKQGSKQLTQNFPHTDPSRRLPDDPEEAKKILEEYAAVDIRTVDPATLTDITDYKIDTSLPPAERIRKFIEDCGNPYCYVSHGAVIKTSFAGHGRLEDALKRCIRGSIEL